MLAILRVLGLIRPFLGEILSLITGIDWTLRKVAVCLGICALLYVGYSLYNKGYQSCKLEVQEQTNEKIKAKEKIRNSAVDRTVILGKLRASKF